MISKTIDVLITEDLLRDETSPGYGSCTWGEEWTRCNDCLRMLAKKGVCRKSGTTLEKRNGKPGLMKSDVYIVREVAAKAYLAKRMEELSKAR